MVHFARLAMYVNSCWHPSKNGFAIDAKIVTFHLLIYLLCSFSLFGIIVELC